MESLTPDEREIMNYLRTTGRQFVSVREICRRAAGKRRYAEDPWWARLVVKEMVAKGHLEKDDAGHVRIRPRLQEKGRGSVSPRIRAILEKKGLNPDEAVHAIEEGDYYDVDLMNLPGPVFDPYKEDEK